MSISYQIKNNIATVEFDHPDSKVNLLTSQVIQSLDKILDELKANASLQAVIFISRKKDIFIAGADIREIDAIVDPLDAEAKSRAGQEVLNKLEDLAVPTIAVIDGITLGGGCEFILACRYRVATFNEKIRIGLPEVRLGIVPGFAGTYRLPRLIGLSEALKIIVAGGTVDVHKALRIGLVDRLFPQKGLEQCVQKFTEEVKSSPKKTVSPSTKKKKWLDSFLDNSPAGHKIIFQKTRQMTLKQTKGFYPAPMKAIDVIEQALKLGRSKALTIESKAFAELVITDISKNLVHVFYLSERFKKTSITGAESIKPKSFKKCAVIGAGVMGGGIAQLISDKNMSVRLKDINYDALGKGLKAASDIFQQSVKRRRMKQSDALMKMSRISTTVDYSGFANADCVIEAVVENMDIKKKVFKEVSGIVSAQTTLCTNTSALSVTEMANQAKEPSRVVGFHFFNPVHRMPLVEVIKTEMTSTQTLVDALNFAKRLGKTSIVVKDSCGFLVNRILLGYMNEAAMILEESGDFAAIDRVMTDFGMPMGPFTLSDEVGLDVGLKVLHILHDNFGQRYQPSDILEKVHEKKLFGKKSGGGFYIESNKKRQPNPEVAAILSGGRRDTLVAEQCIERMVYTMINEAARCLEDGIIEDAATVDVGMIMGTGFPPFRGGLLRYADSVGIEKVVDSLTNLEEKLQSPRFHPCEFLLNLKTQAKRFYS